MPPPQLPGLPRPMGIGGRQPVTADPFSTQPATTATRAPTARAAPPSRQAGSQFSQQAGRAQAPPQAPQAPQSDFDFSQPGAMEQYWNSVIGSMQNRSRPTNLTAEAYHSNFAGGGPRAGLDPYYERAHERGQERLDRAMAARGLYGSGAALEGSRNLAADLAAAQANREADFALRSIAEQRLGAGQADATSRGISQDDLSWMMGGGQLAGAAQGARRTRGRDYAGDMLAQAQLGAGMAGSAFNQMFAQDAQIMDDIQNLLMTGRREEANQKLAQWQRAMGTAQTAGGLIAGMPTPPVAQGGAPPQTAPPGGNRFFG